MRRLFIRAGQAVIDAAWYAMHRKGGGGVPARRATTMDAASVRKRGRNWLGMHESINSIVFNNATTLRARVHDQIVQNPYARRALTSLASNLVGMGIRPIIKLDNAERKRALLDTWNDWVEQSDADGLTDFYGQELLATRAMIESGECLIRFRDRRPEDGLVVPLQLQLLEADHLPLDKNELLPNGNVIVQGVEFDRLGQRVAYHLYRYHPGEAVLGRVNVDTVRVPASEILHLFVPERPGQVRGYPWFASVIIKLLDLDKYDDAELVRKKITAMFAGFVTKDGADVPDPSDFLPEAETAADDGDIRDGEAYAELESGTIKFLEPGEDIKFSEPKDVGDNYEAFVKHQYRGVAAGSLTTYEQLTGDLSKVNFSSMRAGMIEFRRIARPIIHRFIIPQLCRPVWRRFLTTAVLNGAVVLPDFTRNRQVYMRSRWMPQGWEYTNPVEDVRADKEAVRAGFKSRAQVVAERGGDVEEVDAEIAADRERAARLGLVFDSDAAQTTGMGQEQLSQTAEKAEAAEDDEGEGGNRRRGAA